MLFNILCSFTIIILLFSVQYVQAILINNCQKAAILLLFMSIVSAMDRDAFLAVSRAKVNGSAVVRPKNRTYRRLGFALRAEELVLKVRNSLSFNRLSR